MCGECAVKKTEWYALSEIDVSQQGQLRQQMEGYSRTTREIRNSLRYYSSKYFHKSKTSICEMIYAM